MSNGISVCTIIIADDTVLVQLEATVPVVTVHSYRLCQFTTLKHHATVRGMCFICNKLCEMSVCNRMLNGITSGRNGRKGVLNY